MKKTAVTLLLSLSVSFSFVGCNATKTKSISNNAHQQVNNTQSFPMARGEVVCRNCHSAFKVSQKMQKQKNGHNYIECPVCHHDSSHKSSH